MNTKLWRKPAFELHDWPRNPGALFELLLTRGENPGFATQPPDAAIAGTRENMLGKFNAEQHPYAVISIGGVDAGGTGSDVNASITLNGVTKAMRIPVKVENTTDQLTATGRVALTQTAFGIVPYSILAGALRVRDEVDVRFVIHADSISP